VGIMKVGHSGDCVVKLLRSIPKELFYGHILPKLRFRERLFLRQLFRGNCEIGLTIGDGHLTRSFSNISRDMHLEAVRWIQVFGCSTDCREHVLSRFGFEVMSLPVVLKALVGLGLTWKEYKQYGAHVFSGYSGEDDFLKRVTWKATLKLSLLVLIFHVKDQRLEIILPDDTDKSIDNVIAQYFKSCRSFTTFANMAILGATLLYLPTGHSVGSSRFYAGSFQQFGSNATSWISRYQGLMHEYGQSPVAMAYLYGNLIKLHDTTNPMNFISDQSMTDEVKTAVIAGFGDCSSFDERLSQMAFELSDFTLSCNSSVQSTVDEIYSNVQSSIDELELSRTSFPGANGRHFSNASSTIRKVQSEMAIAKPSSKICIFQ